ncbi:MAG: hypothetical protein Q7S10_00585 [bacterium]|nr:hypothetical protein [bacterium]
MLKISTKEKYNQRGFVVSAITFFVLIIMLSIALSMSSLIFYRQRTSTHSVKSTQSYYAAEAGIEDALLKLNDNPGMASGSYNLAVGNSTATITVPAMVGGSRTILAKGDTTAINRSIEVVYSIDGEGVEFNYGAHVGAGGLSMDNGSKIEGNVFSNGDITGSGTITNNVVVSGNGSKIEGPRVNGSVLAYTCRASVVDGNLTYVAGGVNTCTVAGSTQTQSSSIPSQSLPISQSQIDGWKTGAADGGSSGSVTVSGTQSLGPRKINGNLTLNNNATLMITGTLHVTGNITLNNNAKLQLDASYGSLGGVVVADGLILMNNNSSTRGSGESGSYLLVISTSSSDSAIILNNNADDGVFYTSAGRVTLSNNATVKELTGYKIRLQNNAVIKYENGLPNTFFADGPGGGWQVTSWQEK